MATSTCENFRVGREFLDSVSWPATLCKPEHDRCYCSQCYLPTYPDTLTVANYKYVIPRGWTRFAVSVDEALFHHHDIWKSWLNCYHGTSIENAKSCVEHRQLLLPDDVTMHGKKLEIREGHIKGERYIFTTPSISYAALDCYAQTYNFRSPSDSKLYSIKVVLQCKQKSDSIIVQSETVGARGAGKKLCLHIPNDELEWKTQHRSSVMIYGLILEIKKCNEKVETKPTPVQPLPPPLPAASTESVPAVTKSIAKDRPPPYKAPVTVVSVSPTLESNQVEDIDKDSMSMKQMFFLIMLLIATFLPIAALIVGQIYKANCPIQPWIPQWMTVFGAVGLGTFGLIFIIMLITFKGCSDDTTAGKYISGCIVCLLIFFYFTWLIAGSVWVFGVRPNVQHTQPNTGNYCEETLYNFAFGLLLAQYAIIGLLLCCGCIVLMYAACID